MVIVLSDAVSSLSARCRACAAGTAMILALCGTAFAQRQMHDAKAALAMLEELVVEKELLDGAPGCDRYVRSEYASNREGQLEAELIAELGGVYSPYTDEWFAQPTETDIEHIVAAGEAHRSGMCRADRAAERKFFGRDHLNLTLAGAVLNRDMKIDCDAADWLPDRKPVLVRGASRQGQDAVCPDGGPRRVRCAQDRPRGLQVRRHAGAKRRQGSAGEGADQAVRDMRGPLRGLPLRPAALP